ncbi:unnamed protein product [Cuscuta campestris]|uniref:F-box protein At3g26010-like beta-propeller domain-containing protein n=1 Tax=Cuscuta campestris TaxID=132261 RepID=A0A484LAR0_9ASTE|nr:unnamed protein product [Cuscuta campestris]
MFPGSITTPGGAFTPYPSAWAQFTVDPANAQALQGYHQVMTMIQQAGGFMSFAYPSMTPPIMPPLVSTPSTFVPRMVPIRPVNLTGTMNEAAPSNVHEVDEAEQEAARRRKGKAIAKPSKTRDSALKRLGDKEDGPRKSSKLRLGPEMGRTSGIERLGGNRPTQSRYSRESETIYLDEEEAESQPRASAYTRLSYDEDDLDKIGSVARKLRALEEKVEEKAGTKKYTLAKSPFSARVHAQKLRRKIKLDVEKFTGKEDPNVHLDTFHNAAQMAGSDELQSARSDELQSARSDELQTTNRTSGQRLPQRFSVSGSNDEQAATTDQRLPQRVCGFSSPPHLLHSSAHHLNPLHHHLLSSLILGPCFLRSLCTGSGTMSSSTLFPEQNHLAAPLTSQTTWTMIMLEESSVDECVVTEILIRLGSGKSVTQCRLVCKGWNSLISTPYFTHRYNTFQKHRRPNPPSSCIHAFTLVCQFGEPERTPCPIFTLSSKTTTTPDDNDTTSPTITTTVDDITHSLQSSVADPGPKRVKTSCRDLLLLCNYFGRCGGTQYYVVNMLTLEWKKLPLEPEPSYSLGIRVGINYRGYISYSTGLIIKEDGRHNTSGGFKVVRIPFLDSRCPVKKRMRRWWRFTVFGVHIYSSDTNRWTEHTVDWYPFWLTRYLTNLPIVSHNGMLHWLNGHSLVSWNAFDLLPSLSSSSPPLKLSRTIKLPERKLVAPSCLPRDVRDDVTQDSLLGFGLSQDCLHVIIEHRGSERALRVWRLEEEKNDTPSWLLVHKVVVSADLPKADIGRKGLKFGACHPHDNNVIFFEMHGVVIRMNLRTREVEHCFDTSFARLTATPVLLQFLPTAL